jgi:tetratricopeptide (TPR) repeat protein
LKGVLLVASAAVTLTLVSTSPRAAALTDEDKKAVISKVDELWKKREDPAALAESKRLLDRGLAAAPSDYDLLWRTALWNFWCSDDPKRAQDERTKFAKTGWDLGERAVAVNPNGVQGRFFAAASMGNYALGIGIMRALAQRIEGKFTTHLREAERLDPTYAHGGIPLAWGRYYARLPWPKYDEKKAIANYQRALAINPHNVRLKVFWAELLLEEDHPEQAKKMIDEALAAQPGKYDAPEERRAKALAPDVAARIAAALKK